MNHLKYLMVTGKINALGKDGWISDLESRKTGVPRQGGAFEKGETHREVTALGGVARLGRSRDGRVDT